MKKVVLTILTVAIAVSMAVSAFAMPYDGADDKYFGDGTNENWGGDGVACFGALCDFEQEVIWNTSICCKKIGSSSDGLRTRNDWTPTRYGFDPMDDTLDWTAYVVEDGAAGNHAVEIDKAFAIWNDYAYDVNYRLQCDFKPVNVTGFMGIAIEYAEGLNGDNVPSEISNADGVAKITNSGIGFTFVQNDKNSVYVFANGAGAKINLGIDLTADYNSFALYDNCDDGYTYLTINEKIFAKVDWTSNPTKILDANDSVLAEAAEIPMNYGTAMICFTGANTHGFFDNLWVSSVEYAVPTAKYVAPEAPVTEEPKTEAPAEAAPALDSSVVWNCDPYTDPLGPWLNDEAGRTISAVFNVDKPFNEIVLNVFWGSNPPDFGSGKYNIEVSIYKFAYNYANSIAGTPVATAKITDCAGDNYSTVPSFSEEGTNLTLRGANNGLQAVLGSDLPAGQYVMVITNDGEAGGYIVLPNVGGNLAYNKFVRGADGVATPFRFGVNTNGQFVALIADSDVPAPQTGDTTVAMFAVIAVVALAAVVVFKKRVNG